ncbi:hypothetical protein BVI2075_180086 [Burkholderia vietnamiensis]|nr:hypothetical protein BVI2075_180086 [Burkholderia vietnamiensis]
MPCARAAVFPVHELGQPVRQADEPGGWPQARRDSRQDAGGAVAVRDNDPCGRGIRLRDARAGRADARGLHVHAERGRYRALRIDGAACVAQHGRRRGGDRLGWHAEAVLAEAAGAARRDAEEVSNRWKAARSTQYGRQTSSLLVVHRIGSCRKCAHYM